MELRTRFRLIRTKEEKKMPFVTPPHTQKFFTRKICLAFVTPLKHPNLIGSRKDFFAQTCRKIFGHVSHQYELKTKKFPWWPHKGHFLVSYSSETCANFWADRQKKGTAGVYRKWNYAKVANILEKRKKAPRESQCETFLTEIFQNDNMTEELDGTLRACKMLSRTCGILCICMSDCNDRCYASALEIRAPYAANGLPFVLLQPILVIFGCLPKNGVGGGEKFY